MRVECLGKLVKCTDVRVKYMAYIYQPNQYRVNKCIFLFISLKKIFTIYIKYIQKVKLKIYNCLILTDMGKYQKTPTISVRRL